jgi:hypothetical protein
MSHHVRFLGAKPLRFVGAVYFRFNDVAHADQLPEEPNDKQASDLSGNERLRKVLPNRVNIFLLSWEQPTVKTASRAGLHIVAW